MPDGQVVFEISGDHKSLDHSLKQATTSIEKESKKWDKAAGDSAGNIEKSYTSAFGKIGAALAAAKVGQMLADFGKAAINAASDLAEVQNVVDVTFEGSAGAINSWAKNAISQFGLTETKAKQFASTMGAMMKSTGLAGPEIVSMSENLAGLAADMASFYNMDFETAFNKIRSGISGETEPLKQLGINMSVANLEAFALAKGIDKAFNKMSQSEQVMLRYQYLMQATSDAQGDFARTSDGFANGLRLLESNFESLKTTVGTLLLPVVAQAVQGLNDMLGILMPGTKQTTVLDDFANINLQTEEKLEKIRATKAEADSLMTVLREIESARLVDKSGVISNMAGGANKLSDNAGTNWGKFLDGLDGVSTAITATHGGIMAGANLAGLASGAKELVGTPETKFKYDQLPAKIQALLNKAGQADTAKGQLQTIDTEAGKLTKDEQTKFKFGKLITNLGDLELKTGDAATNVPEKVKLLDDGLADITTEKQTKFKFSKYEGDIEELVSKTGEAASGVETEVKSLDSAMEDVTKEKQTKFKFSKFEGDVEGLVTKTGEAATGVETEVGKLDSAMEDVTTEKQTKFKFTKYEGDINGLVEKTGEAAKGIETEIGNIDNATADITTAKDTDFKYDDLKSDVKALNDEVAATARDLPGNVTSVNNTAEGMVGKIRMLDSTSRQNWVSVLNVFKNIPGYTNKINSDTIKGIANAFAGLEGDKAQAWATLMDALGSDLTALSTLTGKDENAAAAWLTDMKDAANGLDNDDVGAWNALFSILANNANGAGSFIGFGDIAKMAQSLGIADTMLVQVGDKTMTVSEATEMYKESMKRLVQLYPELNDLIDAETGDLKVGTEEVYKRIQAITERQEREVLLYGLQQKRLALEKKFAELPALRVDAAMAQNAVKNMQADYDKALERLKEIGAYQDQMGNWVVGDLSKQEEVIDLVENVIDKYEALVDASEAATKAYEEQQSAYTEASKQYDQLETDLKDVADAQGEGKAAAKEYSEAQKDAASKGVKALSDALKELNDYVENAKKSTASSVDSTLKNFAKLETGSAHLSRLQDEAKSQTAELYKQLEEAKKDGKDTLAIHVKLQGVDEALPSLQNMTNALKDQLKFIEDYQANLDEARKRGVSEELLADLSDFSQESATYLYLLAHGSKDELESFNSAYEKMSKAKKPLIDSLTESKLKADETFHELVAKAKQAAIDLNNTDVAKESMAATVEGIAKGIEEKVPDVKEAVDALNTELARLGSMKDYDIFGGLSSGGGFSFKFTTDGSFAKGTDYVPFDNYLAYLHEGEAVLTAEEAAIWRNFKNGGANMANTIDYGQLSGAIWDSAPKMGGNVYLDGQTVGRVISAHQANSYRALERSGWQG